MKFKSQWGVKRKKRYTEKGITRVKCIRCGGVPFQQWQICSDGNNYRAICIECDMALNRLVLKFMKHPHANQLANEYDEIMTRL